MSKIANRRSPSGPQIVLQLPFYGCVPQSAANDFAPLGSAGAAVATEQGQEYEIPIGNSLNGDSGRLDTFEVRNNPVGTDTGNTTYHVRKNGANVGDPLGAIVPHVRVAAGLVSFARERVRCVKATS